jgi:iron complex outermembrane receptor protein
VTLNGQATPTGPDGVATSSVPLGPTKITVTKERFLPSTTTIDIDTAKEWVVRVELQVAEKVEEEITVHATRTDALMQDSPLRVEVLQREEVEEKMLMTPGDIVMMLNEMGGMRVQRPAPSPARRARACRACGARTRFLRRTSALRAQRRTRALQTPPVDLGWSR